MKERLGRPGKTALTVDLSFEDRRALDHLAAQAGAAIGKPVRIVEVIRALVREAAARNRPVKV